jgi:hypothetical protein
MDTFPELSVAEFCFHENTYESAMTVRCKGKCFEIALSPKYLHDSPAILEDYSRFADDEPNDGLTVDDFQDWALQPFLPIFREAEPASMKPSFTLDDYFNPETFYYSLHAANNTLTPRLDNQPAAGQQRPRGVNLDGYQLTCPSFHSSQVRICVNRPEDALFEGPFKVAIDDKTICFFKGADAGDKRSTIRELESYKQAAPLDFTGKAHDPQLHGVVRVKDRVLGLSLSWIDAGHVTLECALRHGAPIALRQKWAAQLSASLEILHRAGVIWGDAKPANVLVDVNDGLWIIDFGGGYTEGWVEKEKAGTVEGDEHASLKIRDFLLQGRN